MKSITKLRLSIHASIKSPAVLTAFALTAFACSVAGDEYFPPPADSAEPEGPMDQMLGESAEGAGAGESMAPEEPGVVTMESELAAPGAPRSSETPPAMAADLAPQTTDSTAEEGTADDAAQQPGEPPAQPSEETVTPEPLPSSSPTFFTRGRQLFDTCGNPFVVRGVEQIFAEQLPQGNDWVGLIRQIAETGVNAIRVLANTDTLGLSEVDALLDVVGDGGMVAYVTPYGNEAMRWLGRPEVQSMLAEHERHIIIDAFGEPTFDDRARFVSDSTRALRQVREWGYRVPLTVTANQFGRDLPSLLELGAEIIAADPLQNTILGWQAYWGSSGYYHQRYGFTFTEAVEAVAAAPFPIQLGLDRVTDFPSTETADFGALLSGTAAHGIGWLWWDWFNPYGNENNLTEDGSATRLTPTGVTVINEHAASVRNTSRLPCAAAP